MTAPTSTASPLEVFYSYAHEDEEWRVEVGKSLALLRREGVISEYHDRMIGSGTEWRKQIEEWLESADIILLLVSRDFLNSDFCYEVELKRAIQRHKTGDARVIPIVVRASDWKASPMGDLEVLPRDGLPVKSWPDVDEAFLDITAGIRKAAQELQEARAHPR